MPGGAAPILDRRTLARDHRALARLLRPGFDVLDVGCGTGAITRGIVDGVGPGSKVVGVDSGQAMLAVAAAHTPGRPNLSFVEGDALALPFPASQFDVVTAARMVQWLREPERAVSEMCRVARPGGLVVLLDYDHTSATWEPAIPEPMAVFYDAFLRWRADARFDNRIARRLPGMLAAAGLEDLRVEPQVEVYGRADDDFPERAGIWADVADSRGVQVVQDGFVDEAVRVAAAASYRQWLATVGREHRMVLACAIGRVPTGSTPLDE